MTAEHPEQAETADVAIVGAGPAGLTAAACLRRLTGARVVVIDREAEPGGIPRHAHHQGFGLRDLRASLTGPEYAKRLADRADRAGAVIRSRAQATGWSPDGALELTSPAGRTELLARAVVLATGCRERPRSARLVAGSRPDGVMTTGTLQQLVYLAKRSPGRRAVVVGAEHVSFSALATLEHGGARAVAMVTELPRHQSFALFRLGASLRYRTPLLTGTAITAIHGRPRVQAVELTELATGATRTLECDTVVFTAGWVPDHELAVLGGLTLDPATRGPRVDGGLRTARSGLFAAGNVVHPAETADVAALAGRHVAATVQAALEDRAPWPAAAAPLICEAPLHWVAPSAVSPGPLAGPPRGRYLLRAHRELIDAGVEMVQDGRALGRHRAVRVTAGRSTALPAAVTARADPDGGAISVRVVSARCRR
ncbi:MAG TPA: FAD-dependent oxidoreductase [Solirubrobacteraceae bacterium]|nr:FAD-dependent oxidoreductase [Solirubrobacteraceae bacterium]